MLNKLLNKKTVPILLLLIIVLIGFWVRLYKIDSPVADWHSWRQADTAAVARNFYKEGFSPFIPKYDDMSPAGNYLVNPERYRFVEFPIYNSLVYFTYVLNGGVDERLARLVSILASLGSTVFIFLIVKKYWDSLTALVSAFVYAVLPFNIYFSRTILPEPTLVFFSLGMFYFTDLWIWKNNFKLFLLSIFFTASAFLIKPYAVFYLLPLLYSYYKKEQRLWPIPFRYIIWTVLALLPLFGWRVWMKQFPEGIPASSWLLNGNGIRFRPAFWRWIIGDRFGREILTVTGTFLFFLGLSLKPKLGEKWLLHLLALSAFLFLMVFATGNVQHDYYQTFIIPPLAIFVSRGFMLLLKGSPAFIPRIWTIPMAFLLMGLTFYFGWNEVKGLFQINNGVIVEAGEFADKILPKDAKVVAPYNGDTAFLYQTNRVGFASMVLPAEELLQRFDIRYYVSVNYDNDTNDLLKRYKALEANPRFVIIDLTQKISQ